MYHYSGKAGETRRYRSTTDPSYDRSAHPTRDPRMTRAHFRVVAEGLRESRPNRTNPGSSLPLREYEEWWIMALSMARRLAQTNPNFDRERFLAWCLE